MFASIRAGYVCVVHRLSFSIFFSIFADLSIPTPVAALELILGTSSSVVALAKKMAKPETKTVTRTVAVPKTKIVKQEPQQQTTPKDTERTDFAPIRPQPPLPNQQEDRDKR